MNAVYATVTNLLSAPGNALTAFTKPMDTLLSLPLVSLLLLPGVTSWSTSFNLLFFYLTWSTLLMSHSQLKVEFIGTLIIRGVFFVLPSALFLAFDSAIPSLAKNIKQHGNNAIAVDTSNGGVGRKGKWWRVVGLSLFNLVLGVAIQTAIDWFLTDILRLRSALRVTTTLPMPWSIFKNLVGAFLMREVFGYLTHRHLLHNNATKVTKTASAYHRYFFHHLRTTLPFSAHFDHPIPYLLRVWLPTYLPAALLRFHLLTFHLYLALVSLEEALVYSNYTALPSGLVLGGMARRTERHLHAGGQGNFSPYGLADLVMGSGVSTEDDEDGIIGDVREEAERRELPEKARRKGRKLKANADHMQHELRGEPDGEDAAAEGRPRRRAAARSRS